MSRRARKPALDALPIRSLTSRLTPAVLILLCLTLVGFHKMGSLPVERLRVSVTDFMAPVLAAVSCKTMAAKVAKTRAQTRA